MSDTSKDLFEKAYLVNHKEQPTSVSLETSSKSENT